MSSKANPTLIGAFVVGAAVLAVAGITFFGGGKFFAKKFTYVAFFDGSLKGLSIGSPVTFRGVRIGEVSNIVVRYDSSDRSVRIPVFFDFEQGRVESVRERAADPHKNLRRLIDDGLRAQLVTQSFVTGQIAIQLDFHDDVAAAAEKFYLKYPEFPTRPSTMEKMGEAFADFDLHGLLTNIESAVAGIDELVQSPGLRDAIASLDGTIKDIGKLARDVNTRVGEIGGDIDETAVAARRALDQITLSVASVEDTLNPGIEDVRKSIVDLLAEDSRLYRSLVAALDQFGESVASVEHTLTPGIEEVRKSIVDVLAEDAELYRSVVGALDELAAAVRSIRILADLLEQHPEALLQGKGTAGAR